MVVQANRSTSITIDDQDYLYFGGTNYLGLAHRQELLQAAQKAFEIYGLSCGASRLTSGENQLLLDLEERTANYLHCESAIVVTAGFLSNQAVVDGLDADVDAWLIHDQAHGSIKSAVRSTDKIFVAFNESELANPLATRQRLADSGLQRIGVFVEPIDPLLGKPFDIGKLIPLLRENDLLVLDEAHTCGVLGDTGIGARELHSLCDDPRVLVTGTFSKAFGTSGGFIGGNRQHLDKIRAVSPCYKVSTPLSPPLCAATLESFDIIATEQPVKRLRANITKIATVLTELGFPDCSQPSVPIFHLPNGPKVAQLREALPTAGICMPTVTSYFADFCEIGLRWTVQSGHTEQQLKTLCDLLRSHLKQLA